MRELSPASARLFRETSRTPLTVPVRGRLSYRLRQLPSTAACTLYVSQQPPALLTGRCSDLPPPQTSRTGCDRPPSLAHVAAATYHGRPLVVQVAAASLHCLPTALGSFGRAQRAPRQVALVSAPPDRTAHAAAAYSIDEAPFRATRVRMECVQRNGQRTTHKGSSRNTPRACSSTQNQVSKLALPIIESNVRITQAYTGLHADEVR